MKQDDTLITTNSKGELVPGSKAKYNGVIYDVGQTVKGKLMLYKDNRYALMVSPNEVEPV